MIGQFCHQWNVAERIQLFMAGSNQDRQIVPVFCFLDGFINASMLFGCLCISSCANASCMSATFAQIMGLGKSEEDEEGSVRYTGGWAPDFSGSRLMLAAALLNLD
eukprot:jgi/Botrbrau1/23245/Bobra.0041s0081.1